MRPLPPGGRREFPVACPSCDARSSVPYAAIARNNYFCSGCGKSLDLQQMVRPASTTGGPVASLPPPRRDRNNRNYKSARKGRR